MTKQRARQILKEDAVGLTDEEIELIIKNCSAMCDIFFDLFIKETERLNIDSAKVLN